jgi:hypothetical protein
MANVPNLDDLLKNETTKGVAVGVGIALVGIAAIPVIASIGRPFARAALKSGLLLVEKGREALAEAGEEMEDLLAEVKAELVADKGVFAAAEEAVADVADVVEEAVAETQAP